MLMYATLAYSSSCIQWTRGIITEDGRPPEYFIDKALQAVRARLSNPNRAVDTWLLISIYALAVTGMWHGIPQLWGKAPSKYRTVLKTAENYREASRIHLRALAVLVTEIGGSQKIENCIRLATLLFLQNVTQYQGFQILATIILRQFDATVLATNVSEVPEDSEVLLWCSCMGGMATEKSDEKQRCFERIASLTSSLSLQVRESHIQELLEKYFFIAERQKDQLLDLVRGFT
ncbi:MAG: hypothetical protein Q9157_004387 [Trypethelium eluteriae]